MKLLKKIYRYFDFKRRGVKVWPGAYVYLTAKIGDNVSIGRNAEIGNHVTIGRDSRIGAGAYIPEGVTIGEGCFLGPKSCFSNDKYPMSPKKQWNRTVVQNSVSIGANCSILPGLIIGEGTTIGMGSVLTHSTGNNEIWAGVPARKMRDKPLSKIIAFKEAYYAG